MKEYMSYSANDKMVNHKIFWENIWNWLSLVILGGSVVTIAIFSQKFMTLFQDFSIWFK